MNIQVNTYVQDKFLGTYNKIRSLSTNSVEVELIPIFKLSIFKIGGKDLEFNNTDGINCTQWFTEVEFNKRFQNATELNS